MTDKAQASRKRASRSKASAEDKFPELPVKASATASTAPIAKSESNTQKVITLLLRPDGATLDELVAATGWQPHTTRAALTGLKKKGHILGSEKIDGVRRYRAAVPQ